MVKLVRTVILTNFPNPTYFSMNEQDKNLVPSQRGTEGLADWAVLPTGAPEEFGVDSSLPANGNPSTKDYSVEKKRVWQRQEAFLAAYRQCGKVGKAAEAIGLTRWAVDWWNKKDIFQFRERINMAHLDHVERWEEQMDDRLENPQGNRGSDVLLMSKLRAEQPDKYREVQGGPDKGRVAVTSITINLSGLVTPPPWLVDSTSREVPEDTDGRTLPRDENGGTRS